MSTFPESLITAGSLFHIFAAATVNVISPSVAITETWLSLKGDSAKIIELTPQTYSFVQSPRLQSRGGGVGLVFNSCYTVKVLPKLVSITSCDLLRVRISSGSTRTFYVYVLYRRPIGSKYAISDSVFHDECIWSHILMMNASGINTMCQ